MIIQSVKQSGQLVALRRSFPNVDRLIQTYFLRVLAPKREQHMDLTHTKVAKRIAMQEDRPDFMHAMLGKHAGGKEARTRSSQMDDDTL